MKNKKLILVAVLAAAMVMLMACGLVSNVESIAFTKAPASTYEQGKEVYAKDFSVTIVVAGVSQEIYLNDSRLTVEGVVDGKLDTSSVGTKTLKVTYQGVSAQITYEVLATGTTTTWADENVTGDGKDLYNLINNAEAGATVTLEKDYDLADYQWKGLEISKNITINGNGKTIKNMTITDKAALYTIVSGEKISTKDTAVAAGFISVVKNNAAVTVEGLTFEDAKIDYIDSSETKADKHLSKNYGVVIGASLDTSNGAITVTNVTVKNAYLRGMGAMGGILGTSYTGTKTITGCQVLNSTFVGVNPVTETTADGEGDKIGGIVGKIGGSNCEVKENKVLVQISGTRDLGGIIGIILANTSITITNNKVLTGSVIMTSVMGGVTPSKGSRNAGGIVGSIYLENYVSTITIDKTNTFAGTVANNSAYEDSLANTYIGGYSFSIYGGSSVTVNGTAVKSTQNSKFADWKTEIETINNNIKNAD